MSRELDWAIADAVSAAWPKCGECFKWMKSSQCPREHNVKGMSRGPSSGDGACEEFVAKDAETGERVAARQGRVIDALISK